MNKKQKALKEFLIEQVGCGIQDGWPCGTCFISYLDELGLSHRSKFYKMHNRPVERHNEVWRAIVQIREAGNIEKMRSRKMHGKSNKRK